MTRLANAILVVSTVLFVAGCSTNHDKATGRGGGDAGDQTAPPTSEPPPPPPPPPVSPSATDLGHEAAEASPAESPAAAQPARPPIAPPSVPVSAPATVPRSTGPATPSPSAPAGPQQSSIRLSTGVALPQTLPTGTAMGFSVDYQFTQGGPNPSSPYVWVVEPSKGPPAKMAVQLKQRGTLQTFVHKLRPEHGPFTSHIEDGQGNRLSRSILLE